MKRLSFALCLLALAAFASTSALADTFDFSFGTSSDALSGSGVLIGTSNGNGTFTITDVAGTTTFHSFWKTTVLNITGIIAPDTFPVGIDQTPNDNLLYFPGSYGILNTYFDLNGLSYSLEDGTDVNLIYSFGEFTGRTYDNQSLGSLSGERITITSDGPSPVPEPNTLMLLGTGILGLAGVIRRKFVA